MRAGAQLLPFQKGESMKKLAMIILAVLLMGVNITYISAATPEKSEIITYLDEISRYQLENVSNPSYGSIGGEWVVMELARYGTITDRYMSAYKTNLENKLKSCKGVLSTRKYTEYARVVIALTAIEENPKNFAGYNLLKPLAELEKVVSQGANAILYTLIALDTGGYDVPEPDKSYEGKKTTREELIDMILNNQLEDGGWSLMGTKSDTDMTAIAIQALAPYYKKQGNVKKAVDRALDRLGELQQKDGGFKTGGFATCESTAQVLTALSVMNISVEDQRFVKNENTVIDGLMQYYHKGAFRHFVDGDINQMATEQAMYALTAYFRSISGMNGLFEMKDGITKRTLSAVEVSKDANSQTQDNSVKNSSVQKKKKTDSKNTKKEVITGSDAETTGIAESDASEIEESDTKNQKEKKEQEEAILGTDENGEATTLKESENTEEKKGETNSGQKAPIWIFISMSGLVIVGAGGYVIYQKGKTRASVGSK